MLKKIGQWILPVILGLAFGASGALIAGITLAFSPFSGSRIDVGWLSVAVECIPVSIGILIAIPIARWSKEKFEKSWTQRHEPKEVVTTSSTIPNA